MESLKTKNQVLKTEKDKEGARHEEEVAEIMDKQSKEMQDLGKAFALSCEFVENSLGWVSLMHVLLELMIANPDK